MIPYFQLPSVDIGPFHVTFFGLLSAVGLFVGYSMAIAECKRRGLDVEVWRRAATPMMIGGLLLAHFVHLVLYYPDTIRENPWKILQVWNGVASTGAVVGAVAAFAWVTKRAGVPFLRYADAGVPGLAAGWGIGRIGCFLVHDHPGVASDFPLAVAFPEGARHDLGLYEALFLGALYLVLRSAARRRLPDGVLFAAFGVAYGAARFFFDGLRMYDARYLVGWTPAQFGAIALALFGAVHLARTLAFGRRAALEP